jgi:hypothetical protein
MKLKRNNMAKEKDLLKLEKEIRIKMMVIKSGKVTPAESGIGKLINLMKSIDEPLYNEIMIEYKGILATIKK